VSGWDAEHHRVGRSRRRHEAGPISRRDFAEAHGSNRQRALELPFEDRGQILVSILMGKSRADSRDHRMQTSG
jgi:hypothetical protein